MAADRAGSRCVVDTTNDDFGKGRNRLSGVRFVFALSAVVDCNTAGSDGYARVLLHTMVITDMSSPGSVAWHILLGRLYNSGRPKAADAASSFMSAEARDVNESMRKVPDGNLCSIAGRSDCRIDSLMSLVVTRLGEESHAIFHFIEPPGHITAMPFLQASNWTYTN